MNKLVFPNSVLKRIFEYTHSQRYLFQYTLVCKAWKLCAEKYLYDSIHFYTLQQFIHFLITSEKAYTKATIGLVSEVTFHFDILNTKRYFATFVTCMDSNNSNDDGDNTNYKYINNKSIFTPLTIHELEFNRIVNNREFICFNDLMNILNRRCPSIQHLVIINKESYMKHIRYNMNIIEQKEESGFTHFKDWATLETLPFWHLDEQNNIMERERFYRYYRKMDIYTSLSGIKVVNDAGFFTLPPLKGLDQLYIDFFHQEKNYTIDRAIIDAINDASPSLIYLTLSNVDLLISDTKYFFNLMDYSRPYHEPESGEYHLNHLNYGNRLYLPRSSYVPLYRTTDDSNWNYCTANTLSMKSIPSTLTPNVCLTHLTLKNIRLLDPSNTIQYLYEIFPHIQSLELLEMDFLDDSILFSNNNNNNDNTNSQYSCQSKLDKRLELKKAIFHLFTSLHYLTKFIYTLHPVIGDECAESIWPHDELSEWFINYPRKLTSFMLPCDLYYFPTPSSTKRSLLNSHNSSSISNKNNYLLYQSLYLQHLTELEIIFGTYCGESKFINDYLNNSTTATTTTTTTTTMTLSNLNILTICYFERPSSIKKYIVDNQNKSNEINNNKKVDKKKNKKLNIFTWLNLCPQLKSLTLKGVDLVNEEEDDDDNDQQDEFEKIDYKIKKIATNEQNKYIYPLQKLTLEHVDIYMKDGLDDICTRCPKLKSIWCDYINCKWKPTPMTDYMIHYESFCETPVFTINATHLILDRLHLGHINNVFQEYNYTFTIGKALVYEFGKSTLSLIPVMDHDSDFENENAPYIEVYCQLMDHVSLVGKHNNSGDKDAFRGYLLKCNKNPEHIKLAKLSRKGLKAYQEEKNHFAEWDYLDNNDDDLIQNDDDDDDDDENIKYISTKQIDYDDDNFFNDSEIDDDDDEEEEEEEEDYGDDDQERENHEDGFLLC